MSTYWRRHQRSALFPLPYTESSGQAELTSSQVTAMLTLLLPQAEIDETRLDTSTCDKDDLLKTTLIATCTDLNNAWTKLKVVRKARQALIVGLVEDAMRLQPTDL